MERIENEAAPGAWAQIYRGRRSAGCLDPSAPRPAPAWPRWGGGDPGPAMSPRPSRHCFRPWAGTRSLDSVGLLNLSHPQLGFTNLLPVPNPCRSLRALVVVKPIVGVQANSA